MDSAVVNSPSLSPSTLSAGSPSLPHPMEDADSASTRKRPRLDSGEQARRNMSTDRMEPTSPRPDTYPHPQTEHPEQDSPTQFSNRLPTTPTKVTINLRDTPSMSATAAAPEAHPVDAQERPAPTHKAEPEPSHLPQSTDFSDIDASAHSSPEIQVAEVEDIGEEPSITRWKPLNDSIYQARIVQHNLLSQFPLLFDGNRTWAKNFAQISKLIESSDLKNGEIFEQLADWIETYLESNKGMASTWWDMLIEEREFWDELPTIMEAIIQRSESSRISLPAVRPRTQYSPNERLDGFSRFFGAWVALCIRMTEIDCQTLEGAVTEAGTFPDLVSDKYMQTIQMTMRPDSPIWKRFVGPDEYDTRAPLLAMTSGILTYPQRGLAIIVDLIVRILDRPGALPNLTPKFLSHFGTVTSLAHSHNYAMANRWTEEARTISASLYSAFISINTRLESMIKKQVQGLSIQLCSNLIQGLNWHLQNIAYLDELYVEQVLLEKGFECKTLCADEKADLLRLSWKFDTLKSGIMEGRMEIRVLSVDLMQSELLQMYNRYMEGKTSSSEEAIPRYLSNFLIHNRIIAYLLGPESHAQLMCRTHNILGFLVVTGKLTDHDIDTIWNTIFSSQESRSSEGVQTILTQCLNLCDLPTLLYLVDKFVEVSAKDMDLQTRNFAGTVLHQISNKTRQMPFERDAHMSIAPFNFCLRIIRQSAPDNMDDIEGTKGLDDWAMRELGTLLRLTSSQQIRGTLVKDCLDDISQSGTSSTGSISILATLVNENRSETIRDVLQEANVTVLLVQDLKSLVDKAQEDVLDIVISRECLPTRLRLLESLLIEHPELIGLETAETLWNYLVGINAIDDIARDAAWSSLIQALKLTRKLSGFIERCVSEFFLKLSSRCIVPGCLEFVDTVRLFLRQTAATENDERCNPTASELIWHLCLAIPARKADMGKRAIGMLVTTYLDSPDAHDRTREATDSLHIELVERCMTQLKSAATHLRSFSDGTSSGEDEPMIIVATEDEMQAERSNFARSATILSEFVRGVRARPMYSPSPEVAPRLPRDFDRIEGSPITIKYQTFAEGKKNGEISTFQIGDLETVKGFYDRLVILSGFATFLAICSGKRIDFEGPKDVQLKNADFVGKGLILIRKTSGGGSSSKSATLPGLRPMEVEILRHFEDLYGFLGMEDALASQVYTFLVEFPPDPSIRKLVSEESDIGRIFPQATPFSFLYSLYALKFSLGLQVQTAAFRDSLQDALTKVVGAMTSLRVNSEKEYSDSDISVAEAIVECLSSLLRSAYDVLQAPNHESKIPDVDADEKKDLLSSLSEAKLLVDRCSDLINYASSVKDNKPAEKLVYNAFAVLLDASAVSPTCWNAFKESSTIEGLVKRLLLEQEQVINRQAILKLIKGTIRPQSEYNVQFQEEYVTTFAAACLSLTSTTPSFVRNAEQFFEVMLLLLNSTSHDFRQRIDLDVCASRWLALLINHCHEEIVGRSEIDFFVLGLARLTMWCFHSAKSLNKHCRVPSDTATRLFQTQLFPEVHDPERMPNISSTTREHLYPLVLALSVDSRSLLDLLRLVQDLNSDRDDNSQAWSWGFASRVEDPLLTDPNWNLERFKTLRAPVGHCGLRNLSNTCYMNSLFTQLYMNVQFRDFMVNVNIADSASSQRLLYETRSLFSYMQDSALKAVDTYDIADSIVTYDNTPVDVTHQVDVDEFFNLLFDRWESQILTEDNKKKFRSFYGGHIVQQIKSKECTHISERLEPFSAIQCDIAGKANLIESLNAYVQGEAMEGDNKYSCTSCGKYVDAVKRACLKDLPQNLIFHLKRFDYDLMHGARIKINDRFEFPLEIDMAPYNINYRIDQSKASKPDIYSLVGILVHSGTAESGHYYSYVQERSRPSRGKWVEFNDIDVSEFKPADIDSSSFGGWQEMAGYDSRFAKLWNAYMLFYERVAEQQPNDNERSNSLPPKVELPEEMQSNVGVDNQVFLRNFCQFDPAHVGFMKNMLQQLRKVHPERCTSDHLSEKIAIELGLDYLANVLARVKETILFEDVLITLTRMIGPCDRCSVLALRWLITNESQLSDLLLKCPHPRIRRETSAFIANTLLKLRQKAMIEGTPLAKTFVIIPLDHTRQISVNLLDLFYNCVERLRGFWETLNTCLRAWDDYFGLITDIANMGTDEFHLILRVGFLQSCLELVVCDHLGFKALRLHQPYMSYTKMLEKGRKMFHSKLLELLATLLERMNLQRSPTSLLPHNRLSDESTPHLTDIEFQYFHHRTAGNRGHCVFLDRALNLSGNALALRRIVRTMVLAEPEAGLHPMVYWTIKHGVPVEPANLAQPFLRAALTYCECTPNIPSAENLIASIAEEMNTIGDTGGREHLEFFGQARRLRSLRRPEAIDVFYKSVVSSAHNWAPPLLVYWDLDVRQGTFDQLRHLYFQHDIHSMDDEELADCLLESGKNLCKACVTSCDQSLMEAKPIARCVEEVVIVIKACLEQYFAPEEDQRYINEATDVVDRLQALAVSDMEDQVSEIGNNSDLPTDSDSDTFPNSP